MLFICVFPHLKNLICQKLIYLFPILKNTAFGFTNQLCFLKWYFVFILTNSFSEYFLGLFFLVF